MSNTTDNTAEKSASPISWDDLQNEEPEADFLTSGAAEVPNACAIGDSGCEACQ